MNYKKVIFLPKNSANVRKLNCTYHWHKNIASVLKEPFFSTTTWSSNFLKMKGHAQGRASWVVYTTWSLANGAAGKIYPDLCVVGAAVAVLWWVSYVMLRVVMFLNWYCYNVVSWYCSKVPVLNHLHPVKKYLKKNGMFWCSYLLKRNICSCHNKVSLLGSIFQSDAFLLFMLSF